MAEDYKTIQVWICHECETEYGNEAEAINCCPPEEMIKYECEICGKEYEEIDENEAEDCCADEMIQVVKEVEKQTGEKDGI